MRILESEVNLLLDKEVKMWAQRPRIMWLKDGDRNTQFFFTAKPLNNVAEITLEICVTKRANGALGQHR